MRERLYDTPCEKRGLWLAEVAENATEEAEVKLRGAGKVYVSVSEGKVGSTTQELGGPKSDPDDSELAAEKVSVKAAGSQVIGV